MGSKDAYYDGTHTGDDRSAQIYSDIDLFFGPKTGSKDITKVIDVTAVKRSVRNLILTNPYEKPFHPEIGSGVRDILFEPMTPISAYVLTMKIEEVIENFEPRARLIGVRAIPNLDNNAYEVTIEFYVVNAPTELVSMEVLLERVR
jgi:phage baseplate assembly protein W|tara:strand:- start:837 stop:1274 length:438 start_codon:yes stop_codon:yes gene_type:complete